MKFDYYYICGSHLPIGGSITTTPNPLNLV